MPALEKIQFDMDVGEAIADMDGDSILDMDGDPILDMDWIEVTDVLDDPITIRRGNSDGLPFGRVAETGTANPTFDNSSNNSAGLEGYYSPDHANLRSNFKKGKRFRIGLKRTGQNMYYKFQGKLLDINPVPGKLSRKVTHVSVVDWMDVAGRTPMPQLALPASKTDDQVMQLILDAMEEQPDSVDMAAGPYTYDYSLTNLQDEVDKVVAAMQYLADSGLGRFVIKGGESSGEILTYQDIYSLTDPTNPSLVTLNNSFLDLPGLGRKAYKRVKRVKGTVVPLEHDSSPVTLYTLPQSIRLGPGESAEFEVYYRDLAASKKRLAVTEVEDMVADTDYKFSSTDGSGNDLNSDLGITLTKGGNSTHLKFTNNNDSTTGYLWLMGLRGLGVYLSNPLTYTAVDDSVSEAEAVTIEIKMPYQSDYNVGADIAAAVLGWLNVEVTDVPSADVGANISQALLDAAVEGEPGDLIEVIDDVSGISFLFVMLGYELVLNFVGDIRWRPYFAYAIVTSNVLTLDKDGYDALDTDEAKLGF